MTPLLHFKCSFHLFHSTYVPKPATTTFIYEEGLRLVNVET